MKMDSDRGKTIPSRFEMILQALRRPFAFRKRRAGQRSRDPAVDTQLQTMGQSNLPAGLPEAQGIKDSPFASPPSDTLESLGLPVLTYRRLHSLGIKTASEVSSLTRDYVLGTPGLGQIGLEEIERVIGPLPLARMAEPLPSREESQVDKDATTECVQNVAAATIDNEVNGLIRGFTDRERFILANRFKSDERPTLEMVGNRFKVTRERVRQIEKKVQKQLIHRVARQPLPCSTGAIAVLRQLGEEATFTSWKQRLIDMGLLKEDAALELLFAIARATNASKLALPEEFTISFGTKNGLPRRLSALRKPILREANRLCRNCGAARVASLMNDGLSEQDVGRILSAYGFAEISPNWWAKPVSKCVPPRIATKVIANCGPVSALTLRHSVARHLARLRLPAPPSEVLVKILEQTKEFALVDGLVRSTRIDVDDGELTHPERVFIGLAQTEGPVVSFESIHTTLLQNGYSPATVSNLLRYSPIVRKVALGLYVLVGAQYDVVHIEEAKRELKRVVANSIIRPRPDGVVEFETNVGRWMIYGGVLPCGPAAQMQGDWNLVFDGARRGSLVVKGNFIQGLALAGKVLAIVAGDRIRVEFNTWTREVTVKKVLSHDEIS